MFVLQFFMLFRELTLDFEQQTCQGIGITFHILKGIGINLYYLVEIRKQGLGLEHISMVVHLDVRAFFLIVFIVDFTYNLLDDVLHGDNTRCTAKLIHHNSNVNLVGLEIAQQVINHLGFGHKICRTNQILPLEVLFLLQMRKQVLDVKYTFYIITGVLVHRHS